jgi:DEAD/DEAH box helicase domain-containing protein
MHTTSYWLTIPSGIMQALPFAGDDRRDGVVGLAFAMRHVAQLLLMCDGHDIGLSVDGGSLDRSTRTGGLGGVPRRWRRAERLHLRQLSRRDRLQPSAVRDARAAARAHARADRRLPCESGCPSCVGPEGNTGPHAKQVASRILDHLLHGEAV